MPTPTGVLIENQLMGVNDHNVAVGFYNDKFGNSHGYTYNINTGTFSADINDPNAVSTVAAAINNFGEIAGFYTETQGASFTVSSETMATSRPLMRPARAKPNSSEQTISASQSDSKSSTALCMALSSIATLTSSRRSTIRME